MPEEDVTLPRRGLASWYGDDFHGRLTANGEVCDMAWITAAHPTLPMPCYARVTNLGNGKSLIVRVNDRGPYHGNRRDRRLATGPPNCSDSRATAWRGCGSNMSDGRRWKAPTTASSWQRCAPACRRRRHLWCGWHPPAHSSRKSRSWSGARSGARFRCRRADPTTSANTPADMASINRLRRRFGLPPPPRSAGRVPANPHEVSYEERRRLCAGRAGRAPLMRRSIRAGRANVDRPRALLSGCRGGRPASFFRLVLHILSTNPRSGAIAVNEPAVGKSRVVCSTCNC